MPVSVMRSKARPIPAPFTSLQSRAGGGNLVHEPKFWPLWDCSQSARHHLTSMPGSGTLGLAWIHLYTVHPLIRVQHRVPGHGGVVDGKCCTYHLAGDAVPQYHCLCGPVGSIVLAVQEIFHRP